MTKAGLEHLKRCFQINFCLPIIQIDMLGLLYCYYASNYRPCISEHLYFKMFWAGPPDPLPDFEHTNSGVLLLSLANLQALAANLSVGPEWKPVQRFLK